MSIRHFFPISDLDYVSKQKGKDAALSESCILIGDEETCKSSLSFQAAITLASEGEQVFYICPQALTSKPRLVRGMLSADPILCQHIKMVYIPGSQEFIDYFSAFHKQNCLPLAFVIDSLDFYIQHLASEANIEHAFASLSALLVDTVGFVMQKKEQPCHLLVTMSDLKQLRTLLPICKRYFKDVWTSAFDYSEGMSSFERFCMSNTRNPLLRIYYHTYGDVIYLDRVTRLVTADTEPTSPMKTME